MSIVSIRLNEQEEKMFKGYANITGKAISELFKLALKEQIETELDYKIGVKALEEFEKNPISYRAEDVLKELEDEL